MNLLEPPKTRWEIFLKIAENNKAKVFLAFTILHHIDKQMLANQPDIAVDKNQKSTLVIDTTIPSDRKERWEEGIWKVEKYQGLKKSYIKCGK